MTDTARPAWADSSFKELGEAMNEKRKALGDIFAEHPDVHKMPAEKALLVEPLNAELTEMGERYDEMKALEDAKAAQKQHEEKAREAVNRPTQPGEEKAKAQGYKDLGQGFVESDAFKSYRDHSIMNVPAEFPVEWLHPGFKGIGEVGKSHKSVLGTDDSLAGVDTQYAVENMRLPGILTPLEYPNRVAALFRQSSVSGNAIPYMEETTTTNAAAETAEAATKPESALDFTESSVAVKKIATWIPVTEEAFADVPVLRSYVNGRLRTFVMQREDSQLLVGDGVGANLEGVLNVTGIQTQPLGVDPVPDAVYKAMTLINVNAPGMNVSDAVFHPLDWQDVRLLRTADGIYIWGSPTDVGPNRIWGLPVTVTTAITQNTALIGAFTDAATLYRREAVNIRVADQHSDFAITNKIALIAEERLALVVFRPAGFCTVTGI